MPHSVFVHTFREAAPYIHYLRGKTLVVGVASALLQGQTLLNLAADLNLLSILGIRLVLVHGSDKQMDDLCTQRGYAVRFHQHRRVSDETILQFAKQVCGQLQFELQAALSLGLAHTPQRTPRLRVATGNFLSAKPLGVLDGVDMGYTGMVRKVDYRAIEDYLQQNAMVLISPMGASLGGQTYHLAMAEVAEAVAVALRAEKLIFVTEWDGVVDELGQLAHELTLAQAQALLENNNSLVAQRPIVQAAVGALKGEVSRVQVISGVQNGALLRELFSREGVGTSIAPTPFMNVRSAQEHDIVDIIALIRPLEEKGVLVKRSRAYLEGHIREFSVLENDRQIYGCVALKSFVSCDDAAELACLVVSPEARDGGYGDLLLKHIVTQAKSLGIQRLFALSTHTADWFLERGFQSAQVSDLPNERQVDYHASGRQSKVFVLKL